MALITFVCASPTASWSPTHNPNYGGGNSRAIRKHQPVDMSDGGDPYSYSHGASEGISLRWAKLPTADLTTLLAFFSTIAGSAKAFVYTDPSSVTHTVRLSGDVNHNHVESERHEVSLELETS